MDDCATTHRRGRLVPLPVVIGATLVLVLFVSAGCDGRGSGLNGNPGYEAWPTPWVEGTLRAGIGATMSAALTTAPDASTVPATPTPTARVAARAPVAPVTTGRTTPTVVPTVRVGPPAAQPPSETTRVEAVDFNAYRLGTEWTFIQGFVQNSGDATAVSIEILVSLIDGRDSTVATAYAHVKPELLSPGSRSPWLAQVRGAPDFARVRIRTEARPLSDSWPSTVTQDLRLEEVAARPPTDLISPPSITGEIVNAGTKPVTEVEVTAAIYDDDNTLIQVARALLNASEIAPGARAPFTIRPLGRGLKEIRKYELFAEARPKA